MRTLARASLAGGREHEAIIYYSFMGGREGGGPVCTSDLCELWFVRVWQVGGREGGGAVCTSDLCSENDPNVVCTNLTTHYSVNMATNLWLYAFIIEVTCAN